jgi:sugar phosphate isomerase/epimerase
MASAADRLPANKNVKWGLTLMLWSYFPPCKFTDVLDVMKDTGFIGLRMTGFPGCLKTYDMTAAQMEKEVSKRNLNVITISFSGPAQDPAQQSRIIKSGREAMDFLKIFGARHLVVFSPGRMRPGTDVDAGFKAMCECYNRLGEAAGEMGFKACLHNHMGQMCQTAEEIDKCMAMTDPKLFHFGPDTAHLNLAGCNTVDFFKRYKSRIAFMDYKDSRWTTPTEDFKQPNGTVHPKDSYMAKFYNSIYDLGDGDVDFPGCHRVLKEMNYKGWICVDLDIARKGPRVSYERIGAYVVNKLEPIYL